MLLALAVSVQKRDIESAPPSIRQVTLLGSFASSPEQPVTSSPGCDCVCGSIGALGARPVRSTPKNIETSTRITVMMPPPPTAIAPPPPRPPPPRLTVLVSKFASPLNVMDRQ